MDKTLKDAEAAVSVSLYHLENCTRRPHKFMKSLLSGFVTVYSQGQIQRLTTENNALMEKVAAEESRRKVLAENSQVLFV